MQLQVSRDHMHCQTRRFVDDASGVAFIETVFSSGYVEIEPEAGEAVLISKEPTSKIWQIEDWIAYDSELALGRLAIHHHSACLSLRAALRKAVIRCKRASNV